VPADHCFASVVLGKHSKVDMAPAGLLERGTAPDVGGSKTVPRMPQVARDNPEQSLPTAAETRRLST
jgi:hypothetical protein